MKWITREHPKIDRIACPWLIRRFIDPQDADAALGAPQPERDPDADAPDADAPDPELPPAEPRDAPPGRDP